MALSVNKVTLIGNLGADPDIRSFQNGGKIANLRVACGESWKDRETGERRERTEWINVAVKNDALVKVVEQDFHKGAQVYVEGKFSTRKWQDQSGNDRYSSEVVVQGYNGRILLLGKRGDNGGVRGSDGGGSGYGSGGRPSGGGGGYSGADLDDEIPFGPEWRA